MEKMNRRALAGALALTAVGALGAAVVLSATPAGEHPDAALLAAWAAFQKGHEDLAGNGGDADEMYDRVDAARLVLDNTQAKTIEGAAVRLSYVFAERIEWLTAFHAMFYGTEIPEKHLTEWGDKMLFDVVKNVRALAA